MISYLQVYAMNGYSWLLTYFLVTYLQPFCQDYALALYISHVMCALIISEWRNLKFKAETEPQILMELFISIVAVWNIDVKGHYYNLPLTKGRILTGR